MDVTDEMDELGYTDKLQPDHPRRASPAPTATSTGSRVRPTPWGCSYNRDLFEAAGLDPDSPPTSWDEVREYAKQITDDDRQGRLLADGA